MIIPIILAGGYGTRLWPISRSFFPKQLISFLDIDDITLLQNTVLRIDRFKNIGKLIIICHDEQKFFIEDQLKEIKFEPKSIILESVSKNTAPAIAVSIHKLFETEADSIILVMPADLYIEDEKVFYETIKLGEFYAGKGYIVTLGILPSYPETSFGYIKKGKEIFEHLEYLLSEKKVSTITSFVEKPDIETAKKYINSGDYFWNSGIFMFSASTMKEELKKFASEIFIHTGKAIKKGGYDFGFLKLHKDSFELCDDVSIDYAVMEKTEKGIVITYDGGWNDLGTWESLWRIGKKDINNNVLNGDVVTSDVKNSYLYSTGRLIAAAGINDQIVIETPDAIFISPINQSQYIRHIVKKLKELKREEIFYNKKVHRPWGTYEIIDSGDYFLVKKIIIKPGTAISMQKHHHRAEHWVVVKGTAIVNCGAKEFILKENESTYIPLGAMHRLKNFGEISLEIIEVQTGEYLKEDDVIRFEDSYGRQSK